ncbi:unnamed protein product, partial [marine sediment metagenome]
MKPRNKFLLYSGGLDSFIAYHYIKKHGTSAIPVYVKVGARYQNKELTAVEKTLPGTHILDGINLSNREEPNANIPGRNFHLCDTIAYWYGYIAKIKKLTMFLVTQLGET